MSTYWDCDCILFTAFILIGDKEVPWFFANLCLWFSFLGYDVLVSLLEAYEVMYNE